MMVVKADVDETLAIVSRACPTGEDCIDPWTQRCKHCADVSYADNTLTVACLHDQAGFNWQWMPAEGVRWIAAE